MRLFDNLYLASGTGNFAVSQPVDMGENNSLTVTATMVVGGSAPTLTIEGSNNLAIWTSNDINSGTATLTLAAAPSFAAGTFKTIGYKYARVKMGGGAAAVIINVDAHPQKF
jgi:hypothetical protein